MEKVITLGSKGLLVREAQGLLNSYFGTVTLKTDGVFGPKTRNAVIDFQKKVNLPHDGAIGPKTWQVLRAHGAVNVPSSPPLPDFFNIHMHEAFLKKLPTYNSSRRQVVAKPNKLEHAPLPPPIPTMVKPGTTDQYDPYPNVDLIFSAKDWRNYSRISFPDYDGLAYVIGESVFNKFPGAAIQLVRDGRPERRLCGRNDPDRFSINNQCAHFVQYFGLPPTSHWLRGPRVCDFKSGELARGTVIATLREGKYHNDSSGRSHVGLYLSHTDHAVFLEDPVKNKGHLSMLDQYKGSPISVSRKDYILNQDAEIQKKTATWTDSAGTKHNHRVKWVNDGEEYFVLLSKEK